MCSLKVRFRQSPEVRGIFGYALHVDVLESSGIPSKIFVYHQSPAGIDGNTFAEFDHIATPVDFQEIPEDAASETVPWYRTDSCTVWVRSESDLKLSKQLFMDDITALQNSYDLLSSVDSFTNQTTIEFSGNRVEAEGYAGDRMSEMLAKAARDEIRKCMTKYRNGEYDSDDVNGMMVLHMKLLHDLASSLVGPDPDEAEWRKFLSELPDDEGGNP